MHEAEKWPQDINAEKTFGCSDARMLGRLAGSAGSEARRLESPVDIVCYLWIIGLCFAGVMLYNIHKGKITVTGGMSMKKNFFFIILVFAAAVLLSGCKEHVSPAPITDLSGGGRIVSSSMTATYSYMTITAEAEYYYDFSGKITGEAISSMGYLQGTNIYTYTAAGKLEKIDNDTTADVITYTYDGADRLASRTKTDGTDTNVKTFTQGTDNLISRIDEALNGSPVSERIIHRDAGGYITSEDIYAPGGTVPVGEITYTRNDSAKTITMEMAFGGSVGMSFLLEYESSGFLEKETIIQYMTGTPMSRIEVIYTLQEGLFDSGGMNGYYYTDKDLFGVVWVDVTAY